MSAARDFRPIDRSQHELLVVDDEPASRYATRRWLTSAGFRAREAATGAEALACVDGSVAAIVLDVHLPDIDGFELSRMLRSQPHTAHIPILHLSAAFVTDEDKVRGLDAGADAYLTHPVEPAVLVATVQALVRTRVAEDAMRRSEVKFRAIYDNAPSGICLIDREGRFLEANHAMLRLLGRPIDDVIGHAIAEFVPPDALERAIALTRYQPGPDRRAELALRDGSDAAVPLEWQVSAHADGVSLAQVTDISARVQLEQERERSLDRERDARTAAENLNRLKDEFIAVLSHELRSPLNAMMGWTHVLLRRGGSEQTMQGLAAIERNGKAQARLISDLLDMSRLNMGKMRMARAPVDPVEVVRAAIVGLQAAAESNLNEIVLDATPPPPIIQGDAARLQQVMWNLLSNAVKFSPKGGRIGVTLRERDGGVQIVVRDQGSGIAPEFLPQIFDRFAQAESSNQRYRSGLGLGLSIVQHLVQAHGGHVCARSEGVGRGATFEVWLPVNIAHAPGTSSDDAEYGDLDRPLHGLRVLVVDDDPEALSMLQIILADSGASVECARNFDEAVAALQRSRPDLLLSDIGLPGRDGHELVREVRRMDGPGARLPAVALTAFAQVKDRELALAAGFDVHCSKPLRPLLLVRTIASLTGRPLVPPARE